MENTKNGSVGQDWVKQLNCAVTVCDAEGNILYMNDKSISVNSKNANSLIGVNLKNCHQQRSWGIIQRLIADGGTNIYTITKNGKNKMIYQSAWHDGEKVGGLVEISIELPDDLPHYDRG